MKYLIGAFVIAVSLSGTAHADSTTTGSCQYSFNPAQAHLTWTAYKTTAKLPVSGEFKNFVFRGPFTGTDVPTLLNSLNVDVALDSVSTGNAFRDGNLVDGFFKAVLSFNAHGRIAHATSDSFDLALRLNSRSIYVPMTYEINDSSGFQAKGTLNMADFALGDALSKLDGSCHDYHAGADGISKVWMGVDLTVTVPVTKICN